MSAEQSTILALPEGERRQRLELKRDEYKERWESARASEPYKAPEVMQLITPEWYAYYILNALLERGTVDSYDISREMAALNEGALDEDFFNSRFGVIEQYVLYGKSSRHELPPVKES